MMADQTPTWDNLRERLTALLAEPYDSDRFGLLSAGSRYIAASDLHALLADAPEPDTRGEIAQRILNTVDPLLPGYVVRMQAVDIVRGQRPRPAPEPDTRGEAHLPGCERFPTGWLCVASCTTVWHDDPAPAVAGGADVEAVRLTDAEREAIVTATGFRGFSHSLLNTAIERIIADRLAQRSTQ